MSHSAHLLARLLGFGRQRGEEPLLQTSGRGSRITIVAQKQSLKRVLLHSSSAKSGAVRRVANNHHPLSLPGTQIVHHNSGVYQYAWMLFPASWQIFHYRRSAHRSQERTSVGIVYALACD